MHQPKQNGLIPPLPDLPEMEEEMAAVNYSCPLLTAKVTARFFNAGKGAY